MAKTTNQQADSEHKYANARPCLQRFLEGNEGQSFAFALYEDPTIDEEAMESCLARIDNLLWSAQDSVFGPGRHPFKFEYLGWPAGDEFGDSAEQESEHVSKLTIGEKRTAEGTDGDVERTRDEGNAEDAEDNKIEGKDDDADSSNDILKNDEDNEDADIDTVRELPKLRAHFKRLLERTKKRRKAGDVADIHRSSYLANVFLVIDQDVIESINVNSPVADHSWLWAIDPDYVGNISSMTKNGLKNDYYGYMRVRVQQLVNNFWVARRYHEDEQPLPMLWAAAQQSVNCAFVSLDPTEAKMWSSDLNEGTALKPSAK